MSGFTKLFSRILDSTVWREPDSTRILWITMLALADQNGEVQCTIPGLADRARISLEHCEVALTRFQEPDKYSSSPQDDGRRIRVIPGGWHLINYGKYRELMSQEDRREKARLRQQRHRQKTVTSDVTQRNASVTLRHTESRLSRQAEAEAEAEAEAVKASTPPDLHPIQYATKLLEQLVMTHTRQHLDAAVAALNLEVAQGKSKAAAYEFILARALDARDAGTAVDVFYLRDWGKHRSGTPERTSRIPTAEQWQKQREERRRRAAHSS